MSFGFEVEVKSINIALNQAEMRKDYRLLFFGAASNSGGNWREMFPASHNCVISIRQTNANGAFSDSNPPVDPCGAAIYGTLGENVPSAWLRHINGEVTRSGSSVATAVAAGLAGMLLVYVNMALSQPCRPFHLDTKRLWTRAGMLDMFAKMSEDMGNRCRFLSPLKFFTETRGSTDKLWAAIIDVC
jgi:hypothetical protein